MSKGKYKWYNEPGNCPDCGWELKNKPTIKKGATYDYYVCYPCRHRAYPESEDTIRARQLSKRGVSVEWYNNTLTNQGNVCAICKKEETEKRGNNVKNYAVDHDHTCCAYGCIKCVRGLLCNKCNRALGKFGDDLELLKSAVRYLEMFISDLEEAR